MKFRKGNRICYMQDRGLCEGLPSGIAFKVQRHGAKGYKLVAPGFGDLATPNQYGNGALYVWGLTPRQRARFERAMPREEKP